MTCTLTLSNPQYDPAQGYLYGFKWPAVGTDHVTIGGLFVSLPGYSQTWHYTGGVWVSAGSDYLDAVVVGDSYAVWLSSGAGFTVPYNGCGGGGGGSGSNCATVLIPSAKPVISSLIATDIGSGTARVSWSQDIAGAVKITYDSVIFMSSYSGLAGSNQVNISSLGSGSHSICVEAV